VIWQLGFRFQWDLWLPSFPLEHALLEHLVVRVLLVVPVLNTFDNSAQRCATLGARAAAQQATYNSAANGATRRACERAGSIVRGSLGARSAIIYRLCQGQIAYAQQGHNQGGRCHYISHKIAPAHGRLIYSNMRDGFISR
jgi:hypothetical protein